MVESLIYFDSIFVIYVEDKVQVKGTRPYPSNALLPNTIQHIAYKQRVLEKPEVSQLEGQPSH